MHSDQLPGHQSYSAVVFDVRADPWLTNLEEQHFDSVLPVGPLVGLDWSSRCAVVLVLSNLIEMTIVPSNWQVLEASDSVTVHATECDDLVGC